MPLKKGYASLPPKLFRMAERIRGRIYSCLLAGGFAAFGRESVIIPPLRLEGEDRIVIGSHVYIGRGSWIQVLDNGEGGESPAVFIGDHTSIAGYCVISSTRSVVIEEEVLFASNVYVSDHSHRYDLKQTAVKFQGLFKIAGVRIQRGAWIGQNAVICPGVTVGKGAVIGANSVVNRDVPDYSVAAGAPARVIRAI